MWQMRSQHRILICSITTWIKINRYDEMLFRFDGLHVFLSFNFKITCTFSPRSIGNFKFKMVCVRCVIRSGGAGSVCVIQRFHCIYCRTEWCVVIRFNDNNGASNKYGELKNNLVKPNIMLSARALIGRVCTMLPRMKWSMVISSTHVSRLILNLISRE